MNKNIKVNTNKDKCHFVQCMTYFLNISYYLFVKKNTLFPKKVESKIQYSPPVGMGQLGSLAKMDGPILHCARMMWIRVVWLAPGPDNDA